MSVVQVVGCVLSVVVAAKVVAELVCYHEVGEAVGVDEGVRIFAIPRLGVQQEVPEREEKQDCFGINITIGCVFHQLCMWTSLRGHIM